MSEWRFLQPVDTLSLRGNRLFGGPGDFGESQFPPRPSVVSGAFRSLLLAQSGEPPANYGDNNRLSDTVLDRVIGTPADPGEFAVHAVFPAFRDARGAIEVLMQLPADLLVFDDGKTVRTLEPRSLPEGIAAGTAPGLPLVAVLRQQNASKPESGWLLSQSGLAAYLRGEPVGPGHLVRESDLWGRETRIGIALSCDSRTAENGKLFTVEHSVPRQPEHSGHKASATGLAVQVAGALERLPERGFLRLGGDGRAASFDTLPGPVFPLPLEQIAETRRFKLVLTSPGIFSHPPFPPGTGPKGRAPGWLPSLPTGMSARLACAAVPRFEVVSGWDLARRRPKAAERAVCVGSVYWFDGFEGDPGKLAEWVAGGLWRDNPDAARRAEGYNHALLAAWPHC